MHDDSEALLIIDHLHVASTIPAYEEREARSRTRRCLECMTKKRRLHMDIRLSHITSLG